MTQIILSFVVGWMLALAIFGLGWRAGRAAGLRAPLPERMRAARADLSRSDAALGEQHPRVRSGDYKRSQRGRRLL